MKTMARNFYMIVGIVVMTAVSVFAEWTGLSSEPTSTKIIDGTKFYIISSPEELSWFAMQVNQGYTEINVILGNNIFFGDDSASVCKQKWIPIGVGPSVMYEGIFDGSGFTIYGLSSSGRSVNGFFGYIGEYGEIKNFSLNCISSSACIESSVTDGDTSFVGGVAAVNYGRITNVNNYSRVRASSKVDKFFDPGISISGGIVGMNLGVISNTSNKGLVASNATTDTQANMFAYSGGIAGYNKGKIFECYNEGRVSASASGGNAGWHYNYVGGIVGYNTTSVELCKNLGSISAGWLVTHNYDRFYVGGIIGYSTDNILRCENLGRVSISGFTEGAGWAGGIIGYTTKSINYCKNSGNVVMKTTYDDLGKSCTFLAGGLTGEGTARNSIAVMDSVYNDYSTKSGYRCMYGATAASVSYFDSTRLKTDVQDSHSITPGKMASTNMMQTDEFTWNLNVPVLSGFGNADIWSRLDSYPIFADAEHLAIRRIIFDGVDTAYTNYKGKVKFPDNPKSSSESALFVGWYTHEMQRVDSATIFRADATVYARFEEKEDVWYSVRFYNADSVLLDSLYLQKWSIPNLLETPSFPPTEDRIYVFSGWNEIIDAVQEDKDYFAKYDTLERFYVVKFIDYNDSVVAENRYAYKTFPNIPQDMERTKTQQYSYTFKGWNSSIDSVDADRDYYAVYDSVLNKYLIRYIIEKKIVKSDSIEYGKIPEYNLEEPMKNSSVRYVYKFAGWLPEERAVEGDADYIANFEKIERNYTIVFMNEKDTLSVESIPYGQVPEYKGENPTKPSSKKFEYLFVGWSPKLSTVTKDTVYRAVFDSTALQSIVVSARIANVFAAYSSGLQIQISNAKIGSSYAIFDVQGHMIANGIVNQSSFSVNANNKGRYIVKLNGLTKTVMVK